MLIIATQEDDDWLSKNLLETIKHDKTHGRMIENKFLLLMLLKVFFKFRFFFTKGQTGAQSIPSGL